MNQIFLKIGTLLFCYTLMIGIHIDKSRYMIIKNTETHSFSDYSEYNYIPEKKYIEKEEYYNYLATYNSQLRTLVIANSSQRILPFENTINLLLTLFFLISTTIIILSVDLNHKLISDKRLLLLTIPFLFYLGQGFNSRKFEPLKGNTREIEYLKINLDDLESNQSSLEDRVSDLEY